MMRQVGAARKRECARPHGGRAPYSLVLAERMTGVHRAIVPFMSAPMRRIRSGCCARAASGHAAAPSQR
jgi:hypothetical protein